MNDWVKLYTCTVWPCAASLPNCYRAIWLADCRKRYPFRCVTLLSVRIHINCPTNWIIDLVYSIYFSNPQTGLWLEKRKKNPQQIPYSIGNAHLLKSNAAILFSSYHIFIYYIPARPGHMKHAHTHRTAAVVGTTRTKKKLNGQSTWH